MVLCECCEAWLAERSGLELAALEWLRLCLPEAGEEPRSDCD